MAETTCELIAVVVTNTETMLSKAQHNFSIHKRAFVDMATLWPDGGRAAFVAQRRRLC